MRLLAMMVTLTGSVAAQPDVTGRLLDAVICEADPSQSYVLYVPTKYSRDRQWPVIFCFDPKARGRIPVERLQAAAELYGYIVAGSLNSRNGPWAGNATAMKAMITDVTSHLSVDAGRVYAAGLSGGARVATALALSGTAKGVIGCSAGFPQPSEIPRQLEFCYFGTTGTEDFNFQEMLGLDAELAERSAVHRLALFEGGHEWAPARVLTEAVGWLELQAMRRSAAPRNVALIETLFAQRRALLPESPVLARWRALKALSADFAGLADTTVFDREASALAAAPGLKEALRAEQAISRREAQLLASLEEAALGSEKQQRQLAGELRATADAVEDSDARRLARRVLGGFAMLARQAAQTGFEQEDYGRVAGFLKMETALDPARVEAHFDLAKAQALLGETALAIASLEAAIARGFADGERLRSDPAFANLADDAAYQNVLRRLGLAPLAKGSHDATASTPGEPLQLPALRVSAVLSSVELRLFYLPNMKTDISSRGTAHLSFLNVETVRPGSQAARAGMKEGLQVTAIQGLQIRGLTEDRLYDAMNLPARGEIVVTVRESDRGKERDIHIPVRAIKPGSASNAAEADANRRSDFPVRSRSAAQNSDGTDDGF